MTEPQLPPRIRKAHALHAKALIRYKFAVKLAKRLEALEAKGTVSTTELEDAQKSEAIAAQNVIIAECELQIEMAPATGPEA